MRLLAMPSAQHLFHSVLAISPPDASATVAEARAASARIAAAVGAVRDGASPGRAALEAIDELALFGRGRPPLLRLTTC